VLAARADLFLVDDTTHRILTQGPVSKPDRRTGKPKQRSGIYTSGAIAVLEPDRRCVLYQTNVGHAGEWLDEILSTRPATAPPPTVMSDALNRNRPSVLPRYEQALCNAHARRSFVDVGSRFPDQVDWVLERYGLIWHHDSAHCQALSPAQRLAYHRKHSLPIMVQLRDRGQQRMASGEIEENSALGQAWRYFINHYDGLTAFCRIENAPIDNNEMERELKLIIRGRNNSLFFKTPAGAVIADVITSVIATAYGAKVNVFEYLVALQRHVETVKKQPEDWLPWTYQKTLKGLPKAP
jgi:transposase